MKKYKDFIFVTSQFVCKINPFSLQFSKKKIKKLKTFLIHTSQCFKRITGKMHSYFFNHSVPLLLDLITVIILKLFNSRQHDISKTIIKTKIVSTKNLYNPILHNLVKIFKTIQRVLEVDKRIYTYLF